MSRRYILDGHTPVIEPDLMKNALYIVEDPRGECLDDTGDGGFTVWETRVEAQDSLDSRTDGPEEFQVIRFAREGADLLTACKWFVAQLESGELVRDISRDSQSDWPMRLMRFTMDLQRAVTAITKAESI